MRKNISTLKFLKKKRKYVRRKGRKEGRKKG
jgi:hypothetical protein